LEGNKRRTITSKVATKATDSLETKANQKEKSRKKKERAFRMVILLEERRVRRETGYFIRRGACKRG